MKKKPALLLVLIAILGVGWFLASARIPTIRSISMSIANAVGVAVFAVLAVVFGLALLDSVVRARGQPLRSRLSGALAILAIPAAGWFLIAFPNARAAFLVAVIAIAALIAGFIRRDSRVRRRLLTDLNSSDDDIREKAAVGLANDMATVDDLAAAYSREPSARVRRTMVDALHAMSWKYLEYDRYREANPVEGTPMTLDLPPRANVLEHYILPALVKALRSEDQAESTAAALALLWIGTVEARAALEEGGHTIKPPPVLSSSAEDVQFSAYYPAQAGFEADNQLYVYAYVQQAIAEIYRDALEATISQGDGPQAFSIAKQKLKLRKGAPLTVEPEAEHVDFHPASITKEWDGDWLPFRFGYRLKASPERPVLVIRISIRVLAVEVAHIEVTQPVGHPESAGAPLGESNGNPLAAAKLGSTAVAPYQRIFVSYSRRDAKVVRMYRRVQQAAGNDVFVDTYSIRAGESFEAALAHAIDTADIFQLFWSEHSAKSVAVKNEWDYALKFRCPKTRCVGFIRPVYWRRPMPAPPPDELRHLHFKYVPFPR